MQGERHYRPEIGVQIALPTQRWSQRFAGRLWRTVRDINLSLSNASGCLPAMNGEFVVAATDMGHHGSMMDASWAKIRKSASILPGAPTT